MKTSFLKTLGLFAAITSLSLAAPITGSIGFTGAYVANDPDLSAATSISFDNEAGAVKTTGAVTGSFAGIAAGTEVEMFTPLVVNQGDGTGVDLPSSAIWSVGGFSLTLTSIWEEFNNAGALLLRGVGVLSNGTAADDTIGEWVATFNKSGDNFTFSASSSAIPDGGTTAMLLGAALLAIGAIARRSSKA